MDTDSERPFGQPALVSDQAPAGLGPSGFDQAQHAPGDVRTARGTAVDWNERMAVSYLDIEAALHGSVPGGSSVWVWLPQLDAWTPHPTAYEVMRSAIAAVDKYRANQRALAKRGQQ